MSGVPWWVAVPPAVLAGAVLFIVVWCAVVAPGDQRRLAERYARECGVRAAERKEQVHA